MLRNERGSVLMEFIIVLPIYFLLIGFVFVSGELSLHGIHMAGAADRSAAFGGFSVYENKVVPFRDATSGDYEKHDGDDTSLYAVKGGGFEEKRSESGAAPWSKVVVADVSDHYRLSPLTRGFVTFWYRDVDRKLDRTTDGGELISSRPASGASMDQMLRNDDGRLTDGMRGKQLTDPQTGAIQREYGYYTLRKTSAPHEPRYRYQAHLPRQLLIKEGDDYLFETRLVERSFAAIDHSSLSSYDGDGELDPGVNAGFYDRDLNLCEWSSIR